MAVTLRTWSPPEPVGAAASAEPGVALPNTARAPAVAVADPAMNVRLSMKMSSFESDCQGYWVPLFRPML
jgi:hypothetical protein